MWPWWLWVRVPSVTPSRRSNIEALHFGSGRERWFDSNAPTSLRRSSVWQSDRLIIGRFAGSNPVAATKIGGMPYADKAQQAAAARRHYEQNMAKMKARALAHKAKRNVLNRALVVAAKDRPCLDCGRRFPAPLMDFDHVRGLKSANISDMAKNGVSERTLMAEIAKCDVVCAMCHRIRTHLDEMARSDVEWWFCGVEQPGSSSAS